MAFVDELDIEARAGNGGNGVVRWLHLKAQEFSGPAGGNGGDGGGIEPDLVGKPEQANADQAIAQQ